MSKRWFFYAVGIGVIIILAAYLRCFRLDSLPYGLNRDEAALAYNSWLLQQTGRDEWGRFWPVTLESFGDYKLPGYPYLLVFGWRWLPVTDFIVRWPSAVAGLLVVMLAGMLVWQLTKKPAAALLAAALVASSPIFIWYARGAWEANLSLAFFVLAAWLTVRSADKKSWRPGQLLVLLLLLLASFFTYNSPLLICLAGWIFLPWLFWRAGWRFYLPLLLIVALAVGATLMLQLPLVSQKAGITIFTDATVHHNFLVWRQQLPLAWQSNLGREKIYLLGLMLQHLGASFSPQFWLNGGAHPWHQLSGFGHLGLINSGLIYLSLALFLSQLINLGRRKKWRAVLSAPALKYFVVLGLSLIPSVITTDAPHATRSLAFFFCLQLGVAVAVTTILGNWCWRAKVVAGQTIIALGLSVIVLMTGAIYFARYQQVLGRQNLYQGGLETVLSSADDLTLIVNSEYGGRAYQYIQVAWALKLAPETFWSTLVREAPDVMGIKGVSDLGPYHFFDDDQPLWENWAVVRYNKEQGRWEKITDAE
jgi:hypothetical protein